MAPPHPCPCTQGPNAHPPVPTNSWVTTHPYRPGSLGSLIKPQAPTGEREDPKKQQVVLSARAPSGRLVGTSGSAGDPALQVSWYYRGHICGCREPVGTGLGIGPPCAPIATRGQQRGAVRLQELESGPPQPCFVQGKQQGDGGGPAGSLWASRGVWARILAQPLIPAPLGPARPSPVHPVWLCGPWVSSNAEI